MSIAKVKAYVVTTTLRTAFADRLLRVSVTPEQIRKVFVASKPNRAVARKSQLEIQIKI